MVTKTVEIINKNGLHARPASDFIQEVNKYSCDIKLAREDDADNKVNAKSIINVLLLALCKGDKAIIECDGEDEETALNNIVALIESGLGEE